MNPRSRLTKEEGITMTTQDAGHRHSPQLVPRRLLRSGQVHHPAVLDEARGRSEDLQLRLADRITSFAGSMNFVWIHAALFAVWMLLLDRSPCGRPDPGGVAGGDLLVDLCDDRPEPSCGFPTGQGRP